MAYVGSELALPSIETPRSSIQAFLVSLASSSIASLHKHWIYHRTLADLESYSERSLRDLGVTRGIEEFARRAAGL